MWLALLDYSHQFHVSLSTLRRRIKANSIKYKLEGGRYFIWADDVPSSEAASTNNERAPEVRQGAVGASSDYSRELLEEKEKRISLLEQHIRVLHQENEALQSLVKMLER